MNSFTAFQTAVALAKYRFVVKPAHERGEEDVPVLEEADFKNGCEMTIELQKYLE
jgi:hypothetical protein